MRGPIIACLAILAELSTASMVEIFRGATCDAVSKGISQILFASHGQYTTCGLVEGYNTHIVVRAVEELDDPDYPLCTWTFYSDNRCRYIIATVGPTGKGCACEAFPGFESYSIDCSWPEWPRFDNYSMLGALNSSEPSGDTAVQSSAPVPASKSQCDGSIIPFRNGLAWANAQLIRTDSTVMVDDLVITEVGDPRFVGRIANGAFDTAHLLYFKLYKDYDIRQVVTIEGPLKSRVDFQFEAAWGYGDFSAIRAIDPERLCRILEILYFTMKKQSYRGVKMLLTSLDGGSTPIAHLSVHVMS